MHKNTEHLCPLLHLCIFSITSITNIPLPPPLFLCLSLLFIPHLPIYLCLSLFLKIRSPHRGAGRSFSLNELERRQHTQPENHLFISLRTQTCSHKCSTELQEPHTHKLSQKQNANTNIPSDSLTDRKTQSNRPKGRMGIFVYTVQLESGTTPKPIRLCPSSSLLTVCSLSCLSLFSSSTSQSCFLPFLFFLL